METLKANGNVTEKGVTTTTESGGPNRTLGGKKETESKQAKDDQSAYDVLEARFAALKKR